MDNSLLPIALSFAAVVSAALITGIFALAARRRPDEIEAQKALVAAHREQADLFRQQRDEARADVAERDLRLRERNAEIAGLEQVLAQYRPTRRVRKK